MTLEDIKTALDTVGVPVTYFEWECGAPPLPYIAYLEADTDNVFADDRVHIQRTGIQAELYTKKRDRKLEKQLENALDTLGVTWQRNGAVKVEKSIMTVYTFEIIISEEDESNV